MNTDFSNVRLPVSGERLVGREKVCRDLLHKVLNLQSCDLMGLRRIGKTSVLKEIERRLAEVKNRDDVVLYVDLSVFSKESPSDESQEAQLYRRLVQAFDEELLVREMKDHPEKTDGSVPQHSMVYASVYVVPGVSGSINPFDFFSSFLRRYFKKTGGRVFVLVDEFDSCCVYGDRLPGFLKRFRHLVDSSIETGFVSIIATSRSVTMLESKTDGDASTLHNVLEHADLTCFDRERFDQLCDLSIAPVSSLLRDRMFEYSFGHPFLATVLLHHYNRMNEDGSSDVSFEDVRTCAFSDFEDYFHELQKVFSSFSVDREVSNCGIENWFDCLVWRECYHAQIPQHVLATFMRYGFWKNGASLPCSIVEFLSRNRLEIWKELKSIETRFRRLIERRLKVYYGGDDWFVKMQLPAFKSADDPWRNKQKPFKELVSEMRARRQKDQPGCPVGYLDCTYLDDLLNLMLVKWHWKPDASRSWTGFCSLFDGDIEKCREQILAVGRVRNPEAHFVEYPAALKVRFCEAEKYLSAVLDRAESTP